MWMVRALLVVVMLAALAGCNSDGGGDGRPAFRNLGKRADANRGVR